MNKKAPGFHALQGNFLGLSTVETTRKKLGDCELMSVSIRQLRYFDSALRNQSISAAAKELNVSQSAVSVAIKELEELFGVALVERGQKGISVTPDGLKLQGEAKLICGRVDRLRRIVPEPRSELSGELTVSISSSVLSMILPEYLGEFLSAHPGIELNIKNLEWPDFKEELQAGEIAFAFNAGTDDVPDDIEVQRVNSFKRRLWVSNQNALVGNESLQLTELAGSRLFIYEYDLQLTEFRQYMELIQSHDIKVETIHEMEAIRRLVRTNIGGCILSDLSYRSYRPETQNVAVINLFPEPPPFEVSWFKRRNSPQSPMEVAFMGHVLARILQ